MTISQQSISLVRFAAAKAQEKGAQDIVALDVSDQLGITDAFLIATGEVERNVSAIASAVEDGLNDRGVKTLRREGRAQGRWVLLDFGDLIVHVFHKEEREYYALERLWRNCSEIECDVLPEEKVS